MTAVAVSAVALTQMLDTRARTENTITFLFWAGFKEIFQKTQLQEFLSAVTEPSTHSFRKGSDLMSYRESYPCR